MCLWGRGAPSTFRESGSGTFVPWQGNQWRRQLAGDPVLSLRWSGGEVALCGEHSPLFAALLAVASLGSGGSYGCEVSVSLHILVGLCVPVDVRCVVPHWSACLCGAAHLAS